MTKIDTAFINQFFDKIPGSFKIKSIDIVRVRKFIFFYYKINVVLYDEMMETTTIKEIIELKNKKIIFLYYNYIVKLIKQYNKNKGGKNGKIKITAW